MKNESMNYFAVGLAVLAGLAVLMLVFYRLSVGGGDQDTYYAHYSNVSGVDRGTLVTYEGFVLGQVAGIKPQRGAQGMVYEVEFRVQKGWQIPADSVARIYLEGLLADTVINIADGESEQFLAPGATLLSARGVDLFTAMSELATGFGDINQGSIQPLLATLSKMAERLEDEIGEKVPRILDDTHGLVKKLDQSAAHLSEVMNADSAGKAQRILTNVDLAAADLRALSEDLGQVKRDSLVLVRKLDQMVTDTQPDLRDAVAALRGLLRQLSIYSENILINLDDTGRNMNEFSRQIRDNPARLLGGPVPADAGVWRD